ncbi:MAG: WG repeat-containing protein [Dysgonamonadaceae bacterium]|jgi:hypothetical protein|nr:WG repeat-containing protein [Dysgonamonadaceae bacterium]
MKNSNGAKPVRKEQNEKSTPEEEKLQEIQEEVSVLDTKVTDLQEDVSEIKVGMSEIKGDVSETNKKVSDIPKKIDEGVAEIKKEIPKSFIKGQWHKLNKWLWGGLGVGVLLTAFFALTPYDEIISKWDGWLWWNNPIKKIIPYDYTVDVKFDNNNYTSLIDTVVNEKYGLKDSRTNEIFIKPQYENNIFFYDGYAIVRKNGKYGFVDTNGNEIIPCEYDYAYSSLVRKGNDVVFFNSKAKQIVLLKKKYCAFAQISDSLFMAEKTFGRFSDSLLKRYKTFDQIPDTLKGKIETKWGLINNKGKEITPFEYDMIEPIKSENGRLMSINFVKGHKWGLLNTEGKEVVFGDTIASTFYGYIYDVIPIIRNGRFGYLDRNGKEIGKIQYDLLRYDDRADDNGIYFLAGRLRGLWEFIDITTGKSINEVNYDNIKIFHFCSVCAVKLDNKWALMNENGKLVCDFQYDEIMDSQDGLSFPARRDNKWYSVNSNGKEIGEKVINEE